MDGEAHTARRTDEIVARYGHLAGEALLRPLIEREFAGSIALVSSFGAEAAVLLHMVAAIDRATPVLFLDTHKHFGETLRYRDDLVARLGLSDVRSLTPDPVEVARRDPDGMLWRRNPDSCCGLRKVMPLERALRPFAAWISGRKRYQGGARATVAAVEAEGARVKVNPLATFGVCDIEAEFAARALPHHPLAMDGFASIGCMPCTARPIHAGDPRSGRWAEHDKTECGIHQSLNSSCL